MACHVRREDSDSCTVMRMRITQPKYLGQNLMPSSTNINENTIKTQLFLLCYFVNEAIVFFFVTKWHLEGDIEYHLSSWIEHFVSVAPKMARRNRIERFWVSVKPCANRLMFCPHCFYILSIYIPLSLLWRLFSSLDSSLFILFLRNCVYLSAYQSSSIMNIYNWKWWIHLCASG